MEGTQCAAIALIISLLHCFPPISFVEFLEAVIWGRDCFTVGLYNVQHHLLLDFTWSVDTQNVFIKGLFWLCGTAFLLVLW